MSTYWSDERIFYNGDDYFDHLILDIDQAQDYITIEIYIFNDDILGRKITSHILKAHKRGVKIQIIVDGIGSYRFFDQFNGLFNKEGIEVKMFNPIPFYHPYYGKLTLIRKLEIFGLRIWRLNKRNHRKIITIDQLIMYTGSFNFTAEHTRDHLKKPWKDMGVKIVGNQVKFAILNFKKSWKQKDFKHYKKKLIGKVDLNWITSPIRLNSTLFMRRYFYKNFLERLQKAENKIWLMTPYFIPKRRLIRSLGKAAQRGVDVRLLISQKSDIHFFQWLQYFYYAYLTEKGVKVYQYTDSILHAKSYIIDNFTTIGSSNLNHRSFIHDLEVDLAIQGEDNRNQIQDHFLKLTGSRKAIALDKLKNRPLWDRVLSRILFLFKYWF